MVKMRAKGFLGNWLALIVVPQRCTATGVWITNASVIHSKYSSFNLSQLNESTRFLAKAINFVVVSWASFQDIKDVTNMDGYKKSPFC